MWHQWLQGLWSRGEERRLEMEWGMALSDGGRGGGCKVVGVAIAHRVPNAGQSSGYGSLLTTLGATCN